MEFYPFHLLFVQVYRDFDPQVLLNGEIILSLTGADFLGGGCTRLLLYFNTNKPHSFFFAEYQLY